MNRSPCPWLLDPQVAAYQLTRRTGESYRYSHSNRPISVEGRYTVLRTIARLRTTEPSTRPHFRRLITTKQLLSFGSALALVSYGSVFIRVFNSFNTDQI
jgi:hypothetical protein